MNAMTVARIEATCESLNEIHRRIDTHAHDFAKDEALTNLSVAQKMIRDAVLLIRQAPTVEDHAAVMRFSLQVVPGKRNCEEVSNG